MAKIKNNDSILTKIENYIKRFVVLPHEHQYPVLSTWVIHTWAFDYAQTTPYIYINSPEMGSGKSLLLDVLTPIVNNPMATIDATGPVIFRAIEALEPTLMFDEVDAVWSGAKNEGLRGVLNGGYKRGGKVYRLKSGASEEAGKLADAGIGTYNTFCPKILCGIHNGQLPATLVDRCIPLLIRRKQVGVGVEPYKPSEIEGDAEALLEEIEEWVEDHAEALEEYRQKSIEGLSDRGSEISWPLMAIANELGIEDYIGESIVNMVEEYRQMVLETDRMIEMLRNLAALFEEEDRPKLHTHEILKGLGMKGTRAGEMELAAFLSPHDIKPTRFRIANQSLAGYRLHQFDDLFGMYDIKVRVNGD